MNKYQEALDKFLRIAGESPNAYNIKPEYMVLKELVDKATPKKPIEEIDSYDDYDYSYCPDRFVWFKIKK